MTRLSILAAIAAVFTTASAHATAINFESLPAGPSTFGAASPSPQTLDISVGGGNSATFNGGVILTNEQVAPGDSTNVYATASSDNSGKGLSNPLTFTFSSAVQNLTLAVVNAEHGNYEVFDNAGDSETFTIGADNGSATPAALAHDATIFSIEFFGDSTTHTLADSWDFAIDNITFGPTATTVPEPSTWALLISGVILVGFASRQRKRGKRLMA